MYATKDPAGFDVLVPEHYDEDFEYFTEKNLPEANAYFDAHGYVVLRGCLAAEACERVKKSFDAGIKSYPGYLFRQTGADAQKNVINEHGFLMNPILNVQDVPDKLVPDFRDDALKVLCNEVVGKYLTLRFGEQPSIVQTMYFEGNSETWPHQDTYYLDSEKIGTMVAAWYALEDIDPGAGRFFVYEKSHLIDVRKNGGDFDIAFNHDRYKKLILSMIKDNTLTCKAPALRRGDVLLWHSKTIHGSLRTTQPASSRSSMTAHLIPESHKFLQFQSIDKKLNYRTVNGWKVNHPKPLDEFRSKLMLGIESTFPKGFAVAKALAIKTLLRA